MADEVSNKSFAESQKDWKDRQNVLLNELVIDSREALGLLATAYIKMKKVKDNITVLAAIIPPVSPEEQKVIDPSGNLRHQLDVDEADTYGSGNRIQDDGNDAK